MNHPIYHLVCWSCWAWLVAEDPCLSCLLWQLSSCGTAKISASWMKQRVLLDRLSDIAESYLQDSNITKLHLQNITDLQKLFGSHLPRGLQNKLWWGQFSKNPTKQVLVVWSAILKKKFYQFCLKKITPIYFCGNFGGLSHKGQSCSSKTGKKKILRNACNSYGLVEI